MSLSGALLSSTSSLVLNASRVAATADNLANVRTTGYKAVDVISKTIQTRERSKSSYSAGGVQGIPIRGADVQGLLQGTSSPTDLGVSGAGFFVVQAPDGAQGFTRSGSFTVDSKGNLTNPQGATLLGFRTDASGNAISETLEPVRPASVTGAPRQTTEIIVQANLPATAPIGSVFKVSATVIDSLGEAHRVDLSFTKADTNRFNLSISNPMLSGKPSGVAFDGDTGFPYSVDVVFQGNGMIRGIDSDGDGEPDLNRPPYLAFSGMSNGAENMTILVDLGTPGKNDGLTQFAGGFSVNSVAHDGAPAGNLNGVSVSGDGLVMASFDNGRTRPVFQVPLATFNNPNGLDAGSSGMFFETGSSGSAQIGAANSNGAGEISPASLEASTVDMETEFTRMILAEIAYKASIKVIQTADEMTHELLSIKR